MSCFDKNSTLTLRSLKKTGFRRERNCFFFFKEKTFILSQHLVCTFKLYLINNKRGILSNGLQEGLKTLELVCYYLTLQFKNLQTKHLSKQKCSRNTVFFGTILKMDLTVSRRCVFMRSLIHTRRHGK